MATTIMKQTSLFDFIYPPAFKNPLKRKRREKKTIPEKDR